ncbi:hypothetical protein BJY00DRAFT_293548 [Aspergillus carlsbadensis]|nr:hypothetical protein BJY00DRAFT_293548 [Aspergillus carlsbadensis]
MVDGLSVAASVVGLATAALQSLQFLYTTIGNLKDVPQTIANIKGDLQSLQAVLEKLQQTLKEDASLVLNDVVIQTVQDCDSACKSFQAVIARWMRHSTEEKTFWADRWRVGLFGLQKIAAFQGRLGDCKMTITVALSTATYMKTTRQDNIVKEIKDLLLKQNESALRGEISRVEDRMTALEKDQQQLAVIDGTERSEESQLSLQEVLDDLSQQQAANDARWQAFDEELSKTVFERTGQRIRGVRATNASGAAVGFVNTAGETFNIDQDISDITADNGSIAAAGVIRGFDFTQFGRQSSGDAK